MNKISKQERKAWLNTLKNKGGEAFAFEDEGLTVVVVPCAGNDSKFVRVSVAQCDFKDDSFKRKRGEYIALERMFIKGESIAVNVGVRENHEIALDIAKVIAG
jgi:hypothetical protein